MELIDQKLVYTFPMPKRLRNLIVLLLVLALPPQGFAAAGMLGCSPGHLRMMTAPGFGAQVVAATGSTQHDHGTHQHSVQSEHSAHDQAQQKAFSDGHAEQFVDTVGSAGALDSPFSSKCSACASCCLGAALVAGNALPGAPDYSQAPPLAVLMAPVSFMTDGPIRPPRLFLA